jgi:hypothetical protein
MGALDDALRAFLENRRNHLGFHQLQKRLVVAVVDGTPEDWTFNGTIAVVGGFTRAGDSDVIMLRPAGVDIEDDYVSTGVEQPFDPHTQFLVSADALARHVLYGASTEPVHS